MKTMKVGIDLDGVMADFDHPFAALLERQTGRPCPLTEPEEWEWPKRYGFSKEEEGEAWKYINAHPEWWFNLTPYADSFFNFLAAERLGHSFYFVTARHTPMARLWTAKWLHTHYPLYDAAVICSDRKGHVCDGLNLDAFIDDKYKHAIDIRRFSYRTTSYLRKRKHNEVLQKHAGPDGIQLTDSLQTFLAEVLDDHP